MREFLELLVTETLGVDLLLPDNPEVLLRLGVNIFHIQFLVYFSFTQTKLELFWKHRPADKSSWSCLLCSAVVMQLCTHDTSWHGY